MSTGTFTKEEQRIIDIVPAALRGGVELLEWWQKADAKYQKNPQQGYARVYDETKVQHRPDDTSYGFFDSVELSTGKTPINGNVQDMFYDEPKAPSGYEDKAVDWMDKQVREFILKYFMRISDYRQPEPIHEDHEPPPPGLGFLSQCPETEEDIAGFGYSQLFYQRQGSDKVEKFENDHDKIVDLRRFDDEFEWIVLKNPIFSFGFDLKPLGASGPQLRIPAKVFNYLVISKNFIVHDVNPEEKGIRGRYGFGYAFLDDPEPSLYGYGPGRLQPAFEQLIWEVHDSGKIDVRAIFVAQEPKSILELSVDPFAWGFQFSKALGRQVPEMLEPVKKIWDSLALTNITFDPVLPTVKLLNVFTGGQAAKRFCISKETIIKEALFLHFLQHYQTIVGSLQTWRQIPNWAAKEKDLPEFVVSGQSN